jgi:hypothetical protein
MRRIMRVIMPEIPQIPPGSTAAGRNGSELALVKHYYVLHGQKLSIVLSVGLRHRYRLSDEPGCCFPCALFRRR